MSHCILQKSHNNWLHRQILLLNLSANPFKCVIITSQTGEIKGTVKGVDHFLVDSEKKKNPKSGFGNANKKKGLENKYCK